MHLIGHQRLSYRFRGDGGTEKASAIPAIDQSGLMSICCGRPH